jgi:hypothetical protein
VGVIDLELESLDLTGTTEDGRDEADDRGDSADR